ncbi:MAG: hypothetical protein V1849_00215 [Chloroflexota bacterium]
MGLFSRKPKVVKEVRDAAWGCMVTVHKVDVDTLSKDMRTVEREGTLNGGRAVTFLRLFKLSEVAKQGVEVTGWETFDQHPELLLYEGYLTLDNKAYLERRRQ